MTLRERAANDERWAVIREYLDTLPGAGLRSVCDAEHWCSGQTVASDGARCFVGHAQDYRKCPSGVVMALILAPVSLRSTRGVAEAFDGLALEYGLRPVVKIAKRLAAEALKARKSKRGDLEAVR